MLEFNCMVPSASRGEHRLHISKSDGLKDNEVTVVIGNASTTVELSELYFGVRSIYEAWNRVPDQRVRQQHDGGGGGFRTGYQGRNPRPRAGDTDNGFQDNGRKGMS
jgi:hypothetical protein